MGNSEFLVLDPRDFKELAYGLHNDLLQINENTKVRKKSEEESPLHLLLMD